MPNPTMTMTDWLSAQARLAQGRTSDPSQEKLYASDHPAWWWGTSAQDRANGQAEALPLGSLSDPVSQAAFLLAPGVLRAGKAGADALAQPGYARGFGQGGRLNLLSGQRGNLGPVPRSEYGEALPRSVVRGEDGKLTKLYHGTPKGGYPDFDPALYGTGEGGNLYGPGIYMTDSHAVAGGHPARVEALIRDVEAQRQAHLARVSSEEARRAVNQLYDAKAPSDELGYASSYDMGDLAPTVRPVYADLTRPFDIDGRVSADDLQHLLGQSVPWSHSIPGDSAYKELVARLGSKDAANARLQAQGYDGITHIGGGRGTPHQVYIAFSPDHVYPAPNVEVQP